MKEKLKTKIILGGGFASKSPDGGRSLYEDIVRDLPDPVRVLNVVFALPESEWKRTEIKNENLFQNLVPNRQIQSELANYSDFRDQIQRSDVIFLHGGDPEKLKDKLKKIEGLNTLFKGKRIIGISAGAYVLSAFYIKVDENGEISLKKGLGYLPIKTVVHYGSSFYVSKFPDVFSWDKVDQLLNKVELGYRSVLLREGEHEIFITDEL
ncbi:MAG: hypothetical protein Fur009_0750 [Candidatus Microgenomates bacterium]